MHKEIAQYLFQKNNCPLPGLGNLSVVVKSAATDFGGRQILAPFPEIVFSAQESDDNDFIRYSADQKNKTIIETKNELDLYIMELKQGRSIPGVGQILVDATGNIVFKAEEINPVLFQPVQAERVIHPEKEHVLLVGDKEITSTEMSAYFNEEIIIQKDWWWVWAIILGIIGLAIILFYLSNTGSNPQFGIDTNISAL